LWDPEPNFVGTLGVQPTLRVPSSSFEYVFSYRVALDLKNEVSSKLGFAGPHAVLLSPSGTAANLVVLNLLRQLGKKRLWIVLPAYFQIPIAAGDVGFEVICHHAQFGVDGWGLPEMPGLDAATDVVWVTHPIYGFGYQFASESRDALEKYLEVGGLVVADECLCPTGTELSRHLGRYSGFIGTYSPHKSVCMNGVKLGVVVADPVHLETLEYLSDVWAGPLTRMSIADTQHFLSSNFDHLAMATQAGLADADQALRAICERFGCTLLGALGPYRSVRVNGVSRQLEMSLDYVSQLIHATGTTFIPSFMNLGPTDAPFSFRVNLSRRSAAMEAALTRLLDAIRKDNPG
jgi:histidinol-phosphate/aromatic aminotransferase/cobyric acid decarboxylase-like protein